MKKIFTRRETLYHYISISLSLLLLFRFTSWVRKQTKKKSHTFDVFENNEEKKTQNLVWKRGEEEKHLLENIFT